MRIASTVVLAVSIALWPGLSQAGDYFFECASPGSGFTLEEGQKGYDLLQDGKKVKHQRTRLLTISEKEGHCATKDGQKFGWNSHVFVYEAKAFVEGGSVDVRFLCEQGGSGLPAMQINCKDRTTKDRRLQASYIDAAPKAPGGKPAPGGDWYAIAGSFKSEKDADQRARSLGPANWYALNTADCPNMTNGYWIATAGPFGKAEAKAFAKRAQKHRAYAKRCNK